MITIFTIPKRFTGHFGLIQRNAIASWINLDIHPEVILFGDDEGTAEAAQEFGVTHVPNVARNDSGTPLLSDVFSQAKQIATSPLICYINGDIILLNDFGRAVTYVSKIQHPFLMTGQRWDTDITTSLKFGENYEQPIRTYALEHGQLYSPLGMDYFVFPRSFLPAMPPFAVGRPMWDNWTLYYVRSQKAMVIDATQVVLAIHQNHDYSHHPQGQAGVWEGKERQNHFELAGGWGHIFTLADATHLLTPAGLKKPAISYSYLRRRIVALGILQPRFHLLSRIINKGFNVLEAMISSIATRIKS